MTRTKLIDRKLPRYTVGEEIFNMTTHIVGGALGVLYLVACILISAAKGSALALVTSIIYATSVISVFTISSIYHGLRTNTSKKVMQVIDHCTIYFMIAGTYTPITMCAIRPEHPLTAWVIFGIVWGVSALAIVLNAIDLKRFAIFSNICYLALGWCVLLGAKVAFSAIGLGGTLWLLAGGIIYSLGAVFYLLGRKKKYIHSVFHILVVLASFAHFISVAFYVI